ncbi:MAG: rplD [Rickettsiaceae bacterium]|jgi:large subunit ribosomal protein L4|nr:rplD [Rickettsiaceae bacterium]
MVDLKNINFSTSEVTTTKLDFAVDQNSGFESPRSVAYVLSWQLSKKRTGSAQTKTMAEISGTTAKPHKQKGTGHARQGSKRSVQFRGGRTCFGPRARSFDYSLPKKIVKTALSDVIKLKIKENKLVLFSCDSGLKTANVSKLLKSNKIDQALFLYQSKAGSNEIVKPTRNLKNVKALDFKGLNVYDILNFDFLVLDKNLFQTIKEVAL